ncbi:class I SAM-dependent methyltransferase [Sandaracinobacteroides sp. A072]|uniref:class I SAM-dependent methyltransferase n=1 Tax=Sandaracinobacteroides sp. A072 TaxID=3461146 RepID=UPI0040429638
MSNWWDRHVVPKLLGYACTQPPIMKCRSFVVPDASGKVLELGAGGGINLPFYDRGKVESVTGIDPSEEMIAEARAHQSEADRTFVRLERGRAEELPFASGSFDTVVTTFTLCSVQDQQQALKEAARVLKPDGRLLFLEHGLAPDAAVQRWQRRIEPVWKRIAGGCHLSRPVTDAVEAAGFRVAERHGQFMEKSPRFAGWVEWGVATPGARA